MLRPANQQQAPQTQSEFIDALRGEVPYEDGLACSRSLIIGCGGWGRAVIGQVKKDLLNTSVEPMVRILQIDTDESEQAGRGGGPALDNREFLHLDLQPMLWVMNNLEEHPAIRARFGLEDPERLEAIQRVISGNPGQASQWRIIGALAAATNADVIRNAIANAKAELFGRFNDLEFHRGVRPQERFNVILVGSSFGGTGSGIVIDTAAIARDQLTNDGCPFNISLYTITPDVFASVLQGSPMERNRCEVNYYKFMRELNAGQLSHLHRKNVMIGGTAKNQFRCPERLFNQVFVLQRKDAAGRDYRTIQAIADVAAMHISSDLSTPMGNIFDMAEQNGMIGQGLAPDPITGELRFVSTASATAIGMNKKNILKFSVLQQQKVLFGEVLGTPLQNPEKQAHRILLGAGLTASENESPEVCLQLGRELPSAAVYTKSLYRLNNGSQRKYFKDKVLPSRFTEIRQKFSQTLLPNLVTHLKTQANTIKEQAILDLRTAFQAAVNEQGLRSALALATSAVEQVHETTKTLAEYGKAQVASHQKQDALAQQIAKELTRYWFAGWRSHPKEHEQLIAAVRSSINAAMQAKVLSLTQNLFHELEAWLSAKVSQLEKSCQTLERELLEIDRVTQGLSIGKRKTTEKENEIDITDLGYCKAFLDKHLLSTDRIISTLQKLDSAEEHRVRIQLGTNSELQDTLRNSLSTHFEPKVRALSIAEVIAYVLKSEAGARKASRLREVFRILIESTQPMFQIQLPHVDLELNDTFLLGLPDSVDENARLELQEMAEQAILESRGNPMFHAELSLVPTQQTERILCLRAVHGARPNYLTCWDQARRTAERWDKTPPHPTETFNPGISNSLPHVGPLPQASRGELAFALGMAFGWIAKRGDFYYENLQTTGSNGSTRLVCRLKSHEQCLASVENTARSEGPLAVFQDKNRLTYEDSNDVITDQRIAQGRDQAMREFASNRQSVDLVMSTFDTLCELGGNHPVASLLRSHAELQRGTKPSSQLYDQISREATLLEQLCDKLER